MCGPHQYFIQCAALLKIVTHFFGSVNNSGWTQLV